MDNNIKWWIGIVESKDDPESRGRIKVRILGIHTKESVRQPLKGYGIPLEDLPFAVCCMPLTYGGIAASTVAPPGVLPGAWVIGISLDGDAYQNLIVLGIISIALSPLATHTGSDLGLANGYQQVGDEITDTDTCKESYKKAIKNISSSANGIKANSMSAVLEYVKANEPQKYAKFVEDSGVEINSDTAIAQGSSNSSANSLLAESYYDYCLDTCKDPVLAALAYNSGYGKAISGYSNEKSFIQKYGDPRKKEISYEDLANRIESEDKDAAKFIRDFISEVGEDRMNSCVYGTGTSSSSGNSTTTSGNTVLSTDTASCGLEQIALPTNSNVITSAYKSPNRPDYAVSKAGQHLAIDIRAYSGDPIRSMAKGTVIAYYPKWGGIEIDHGSGIKTKYLHMRKVNVKVGDKVKVGQQIGESGNKGLPQSAPHLHFVVKVNDTPINPEEFLEQNGIKMTRKAGA